MISLDTEIRKLRPVQLYSLAKILSPDFWKILMGNIKKPGKNNIPMFTSEHIAMIEIAATQQRKSASEIFLDEWGTMGRERPTIRTTIDLLVQTELFRAADFLAVEVMKGSPPNRPLKGPAAAIEIPDNIIEQYNQNDLPNKCFDSCCVSTAKVCTHNSKRNILVDNDDIVFQNPFNTDTGVIEMKFSELSVKNNNDLVANSPSNSNSSIVSDMIKFTSDHQIKNDKIIDDKKLIEHTTNVNKDINIDNFSEKSSNFLPNLSVLMLDSKKNSTEQKESLQLNVSNFPQELVSSELPLCINDRGILSSYQEYSHEDKTSNIYSDTSDTSYSNTRDNVMDCNSTNNLYKLDILNKQENKEVINDDETTSMIAYDGLPLTVVEFCKN